MKNERIAPVLITLTMFALVACNGSTPAPKPAPTEEVASSQPVVDETPISLDQPQQEIASLIARNEFDEARAKLDPLIDASGDDGRLIFLRGLIPHTQGDYAAARPDLERAVELSPGFAAGYHFLGWCRFHDGDLPAAREAFKAHLDRAPDEADSHFGLGLVELESGQLDDAEASFRTAIELTEALEASNPRLWSMRRRDLPKAHIRLADVHMLRDDYEAAKDEILAALEIDTTNAEPYRKLATCYEHLGRPDLVAIAMGEFEAVSRGERPGRKPGE